MTKLLSKDQILTADDLPSQIVDIPQWGGSVKIRTMTGTERDSFEQEIMDSRKKNGGKEVNLRAISVSFAAVDEEGNRLFTTEEAVLLGKKSCRVLDRLFWAANNLNQLNGDAELVKN